jgi:hypothetical protein
MLTEQPCAQIQIGDPGILHTVVLGDNNISSFYSSKFSTETSTEYSLSN